MTQNTKNFIAKVVIVLGLIASYNLSSNNLAAPSAHKTDLGSYVLQPLAMVGDD